MNEGSTLPPLFVPFTNGGGEGGVPRSLYRHPDPPPLRRGGDSTFPPLFVLFTNGGG